MSSSKGEEAPPCPDPSVHDQSASSGSANKAAQLASQSGRPSSSRDVEALGPDGKLSAAGAATSLRYAQAKDLPSFPSVGIDTVHSGSRAATLASSNQKSPEMWKPDTTSSSASKAALLAAKDGGKLDLWKYSPDGTGNSAASIAMAKKNIGPQLDYGYTDEGHKKALLAATKSLSVRERPMSVESVPSEQYPDQANASFNAQNAASVAGRPGSAFSSSDAARVQNTQGVSREMYTERPPVALEVEEKRHREALRASAISMANQLYNLERADVERSIQDPGSVAAERVAAQSYSAATTNMSGDALKMQAMNYSKVQEAAQKLAAERLAKLDPDGVYAYREHYGYGPSYGPAPSPKEKSKRSSRHGRTTSQDDDDSDDAAQAAKIKSQMSRFNDQIATVDANKRTQDRENVLAAAQRNVQARMHAMDEKVFAETGKIPPSIMEEWEAKARAKAAEDSEQRLANHGKVHIGGGKYMDQSEVDAIAAARMQPTLDEINDEAERRRAHEAAVKLDLERHKERVEAEKQRERETKAELKRVQDEEKEKQRQEKAAEKEKARQEKDAEKERLRAEKAQRDQEKKQAKEEAKQAKEEAKQAKEQEKLEKVKAEHEQRQREILEKQNEQEAAAGAATTETGGETTEDAPDTTEEPDKTEAPDTTDAPDTTEASREVETTEEPPAETEEKEAEFTEPAPPVAQHEPLTEPLQLGPEPHSTDAQATETAEGAPASPLKLTPDPVAAVAPPEEKPSVTEDKPTTTDDKPSATDDEPSTTDDKPSAADDEPSPTDGQPSATDDKAAATDDKAAAADTSTAPASGRRDSRVKSFLGKFKRAIPATTSTSSNTTSSAAAAPAEAETSKGTEPEPVSPVSNEQEENDKENDASTTDVFEEARDRFDSVSDANRASMASETATETPVNRTGSKFQEDL